MCNWEVSHIMQLQVWILHTHTHIHHTIGVILGFQALIEQGHGLRTSVRSYIHVEKCSAQSWLNPLRRLIKEQGGLPCVKQSDSCDHSVFIELHFKKYRMTTGFVSFNGCFSSLSLAFLFFQSRFSLVSSTEAPVTGSNRKQPAALGQGIIHFSFSHS